MRRLALPLCLAAAAVAACGASAAAPKLGAGDATAVRALQRAAATLTQQLRPRVRASLARTGASFAVCRSRYVSETKAHQQLITEQLLAIAYIQAVKAGLPLWKPFIARVQQTRVSSPLLQAASQATTAERAQGAAFARIRLDVCGEVAKLAGSGYRASYVPEWLGGLERQAGASNAAGKKADAAIHASRPALLAAGLTPAQAKSLMDAETGDVFSVILGFA